MRNSLWNTMFTLDMEVNKRMSGLGNIRGAGGFYGNQNPLLSKFLQEKKPKKSKKKKKYADISESGNENLQDSMSGQQNQDKVSLAVEVSGGKKDISVYGQQESRKRNAEVSGLGAAACMASGGNADLQRAVVWSEILGEPAYKKHRRKRMNQQYGYQGNANRR